MRIQSLSITSTAIIVMIALSIYGCAQAQKQASPDNIPAELPTQPPAMQEKPNEVRNMSMKITSPAFRNNGNLPSKYTCDGEDINPPLEITGMPEGTKSLVLIVDDPDAPVGIWDHWVVWNIRPTDSIPEDTVPGVQGTNSWGKNNWGGPCPPNGTHRYLFKLYALDTELKIPASSNKAAAEKAMQGHILAQAEILGKYSRG